jgi:hypothetical protein
MIDKTYDVMSYVDPEALAVVCCAFACWRLLVKYWLLAVYIKETKMRRVEK